MRSVLPILLLGVAGILVGGVVSMRKQGARTGSVIFVGLLAAVAAAAGVLWLIPES